MRIESIKKDENHLNIHPGFYPNEFRYGFKNFRFNFAAPTFVHESDIMYRYRLMGYSPKWSRWIYSNFKEYTNLSHGSYTFIVEARNELGVLLVIRHVTIFPLTLHGTLLYG